LFDAVSHFARMSVCIAQFSIVRSFGDLPGTLCGDCGRPVETAFSHHQTLQIMRR